MWVGEAGGILTGGVWWLRKMEEALRMQWGWSSRAAQPHCCSVSACPCPHPTLFSFFRTTSLFLTSRTPAATPRPRHPPRPPRQRPHSRPAPRRLLPYTLLLSAQGSRRISTCQVPSVHGRSWVSSRVRARAVSRPVRMKGDELAAYGLSLTICRATAA